MDIFLQMYESISFGIHFWYLKLKFIEYIAFCTINKFHSMYPPQARTYRRAITSVNVDDDDDNITYYRLRIIENYRKSEQAIGLRRKKTGTRVRNCTS